MNDPKEKTSKITNITYPSKVWSDAMANANRAANEFVPILFKGASLIELKKLRAKLAKK